ncbi:hypothetical protein SAMN05216489_06898 [Streptomyces sp. 3213]|nr:hypothetical protein SAMN05216489_06898 [Streptomyces sp. 3213] [Streptomyces sp. 3213.3]
MRSADPPPCPGICPRVHRPETSPLPRHRPRRLSPRPLLRPRRLSPRPRHRPRRLSPRPRHRPPRLVAPPVPSAAPTVASTAPGAGSVVVSAVLSARTRLLPQLPSRCAPGHWPAVPPACSRLSPRPSLRPPAVASTIPGARSVVVLACPVGLVLVVVSAVRSVCFRLSRRPSLRSRRLSPQLSLRLRRLSFQCVLSAWSWLLPQLFCRSAFGCRVNRPLGPLSAVAPAALSARSRPSASSVCRAQPSARPSPVVGPFLSSPSATAPPGPVR